MASEKVGGGQNRHPKRLIFAPGDIEAPPTSPKVPHAIPTPKISGLSGIAPTTANSTATAATDTPAAPVPIPALTASLAAQLHLSPSSIVDDPTRSGASTPSTNAAVVSHASRAHQFVTNPPLRFSHLNHKTPLHQFHTWFRDARLLPSSAPETCTMATASMPSGRVSARIVYLKELDEKGWVVYSNWGSKAGKGGQVFGSDTVDKYNAAADGSSEEGKGTESSGDTNQQQQEGNKWVALTFNWPTVERQVRIEGLAEPLSKEESETYWRVRERGSQIGAWASQQSQVLWSRDPVNAHGTGNNTANRTHTVNSDVSEEKEGEEDGRSVLENRVKDVETRFADTQDIPLPPFWGGIRVVPESVEFWQGRKSRLHDRFRYVRVDDGENNMGGRQEKGFRWRIERLSP